MILKKAALVHQNKFNSETFYFQVCLPSKKSDVRSAPLFEGKNTKCGNFSVFMKSFLFLGVLLIRLCHQKFHST